MVSHDISVELVAVNSLRPHEHTSPGGVAALVDDIAAQGVWTTPLLVDIESHTVLDGHHRLEVAKTLGLARIPAALVRYSDSNVQVRDWRTGAPIEKEDVVRSARDVRLMPAKTTRHTVAFALPSLSVVLGDLAADPVRVSGSKRGAV